MDKIYIILGLVCLNSIGKSQVTEINGIVNDYTSVLNVSGKQLNIQSSANFNIGDKVLLIQMQGARINETNSSSFGDIIDISDAGNYEFSEVCEILNDTQILVKDIQRSYSPDGKVQLVSVPIYKNAIITDTLRCLAWDGSIGGILAFECTGKLTMNYGIDLKGTGFRGGNTSTSTYSCFWAINNRGYHYNIASGEGAKKGEGIAAYITGKTGGRGSQANGGGGGNDHNSGGGGGGNGSAGGTGGNRIKASAFTCGSVTPGIGGYSNTFSNSTNKIFLGGGGGAGHEDNLGAGSKGSNGGGIVIIKTDTLFASGNSIIARGGFTQDSSLDGAGGGGAGGSVILDVKTYKGDVYIDVSGGNGGSVANISENCNGPGGGGAGGIIWFSQIGKPSELLGNLGGGLAGKTLTSAQSNCTIGETNGATNGRDGQYLGQLSLIEIQSIPLTKISTTLCAFDSALINDFWRFTSGLYYDTIITYCRDSIIETQLTLLPAKLGSFSTLYVVNQIWTFRLKN
jgi:hypothetical protein